MFKKKACTCPYKVTLLPSSAIQSIFHSPSRTYDINEVRMLNRTCTIKLWPVNMDCLLLQYVQQSCLETKKKREGGRGTIHSNWIFRKQKPIKSQVAICWCNQSCKLEWKSRWKLEVISTCQSETRQVYSWIHINYLIIPSLIHCKPILNIIMCNIMNEIITNTLIILNYTVSL